MSKVALEFIQRYHLEGKAAQFDVIAIQLFSNGYKVDFIKNAFELNIPLP